MDQNSTSPAHLKTLPFILGSFLKDPVGFVRRPIDFTWTLSFALLAVSALVSGGVSGAITHNSIDFLIGIFIFPITSVVASLVFGFFIYYYFSLFKSTFLDFRRLLSLISVALVPYFLFHTVSSYLIPIDLLGFAFTCVLLVVGLAEQFGLDRKTCSRLVAGLALLFFLAWSIALVRNSYQ